jgi:hypothetical protein
MHKKRQKCWLLSTYNTLGKLKREGRDREKIVMTNNNFPLILFKNEIRMSNDGNGSLPLFLKIIIFSETNCDFSSLLPGNIDARSDQSFVPTRYFLAHFLPASKVETRGLCNSIAQINTPKSRSVIARDFIFCSIKKGSDKSNNKLTTRLDGNSI